MKKIENVRYWRDPDLKGFEICRVFRSRHVFPNHAHENTYAIALMEAGGSYCLGPGKEDAFVGAGEIALINPNQVHSGVPAPDVDVTYRMLYVDSALMQNMASDLCEADGTVPEFRRVVIRKPELSRRFGHICNLMAKGSGRLEKESAMTEAFACLLSGYGGVRNARNRIGSERRAVRQARAFLAENLDCKVSLEEVAGAVGLSRYHFLRVFKKETGLSPHVFRTQQRIDAARLLLRQGFPFAQVALETGFTDQSHFTNKFRQFTGATPRQYLSRVPL